MSLNDQMIVFHDGFTIEKADTQGNRTAIQCHVNGNPEERTRTYTVDFYDHYYSKLMYRREYKTVKGLFKAIMAHCDIMQIDYESLERHDNLTMIMVDNPNIESVEAVVEAHKGSVAHDLLMAYYPGASCHIGGGIWLSRCNHCDYAIASYGHMNEWLSGMGQHKIDKHNSQVPGMNVGLLS